MEAVEKKVGTLEEALRQLAQSQAQTQQSLRMLSEDSRHFKDEMGAFKDEMRQDRHEMNRKWGDLAQSQAQTQQSLRMLSEDSRHFKDEMSAFKDEMGAFKDEMRQDRHEMNRKWGDLANKMGTLVEDIVAPNLPRIAREDFGLEKEPDDFMIHRHKRKVKDSSRRREFDAIAVYGDAVIINETKSSPNSELVNEFKKVLSELGEYFPEFKGKRIIPIFSSLNLPIDLVKHLSRQNIYGLAMGEDTMKIVNKDEVSPRLPKA